jgi:hypothetical protein
MSAGIRRAFGLSDLMILTAATAVGLVAVRWAFGGFIGLTDRLPATLLELGASETLWTSRLWAMYWVYGFSLASLFPFALTWTLAILILQMRRPSARGYPSPRKPGIAACRAAAISFTATTVLIGFLFLAKLPLVFENDATFEESLHNWSIILVPPLTGFAIMGSWTTLYFEGDWCADASWMDRIGRFLGAFWIGSTLLPVWVYNEVFTRGFLS